MFIYKPLSTHSFYGKGKEIFRLTVIRLPFSIVETLLKFININENEVQ